MSCSVTWPRCWLFFLVLLLPSLAVAATYHVVASGGGGTACTSGSPCSSITQAINNSTSGDTVLIHAGTYDQNNFFPKSGTTVQGESRAGTIIRPTAGSNNPCFEILSGTTNVTIKSLTCDGASEVFSYGMRIIANSGSTVDDVEIAYARNQGIAMFCDSNAVGCGAGNNTVKNSHIHHSGQGSTGCHGTTAQPGYCHGIYDYSDGNSVINVESDHNNGWGLQFYGANNIVRNTVCHDNFSGGMTVPTSVTAYNSIFWGNQGNGIWSQWYPSTYYSLTIYGNSAGGLYFQSGTSSSSVARNVISNNNSPNVQNDAGASVANTVTTSVAFVNAGAQDFHLTSSATNAIDQGTTLGSPYNIDMDGAARPVGCCYDAGAYEYGGTSTSAPPAITITAPTSGTTYGTSTTPLTTLAGTATDDVGVTSVSVSCSPSCGTPTVSCPSCGSSGTSVTWSVASIPLTSGSNAITVTASDAQSQTATDTLTVTYSAISRTPALGTYYIGPSSGAVTGDDTRTCAQATAPATPLATLATAVQCALGGSTFFYRAGTYTEIVDDTVFAIPGGSSFAAPTTISRYSGEVVTWAPTLSSTQVAVVLQASTSQYIVFQGITIDAGGTGDHVVYFFNASHHIKLQDMTLKNSGRAIIQVESPNHQLVSNTLQNNTQNVGLLRIMEVAGSFVQHNDLSGFTGRGIVISSSNAGVAFNSNTTIDSNRIHAAAGTPQWAIEALSGTGLLAMNNILDGSGLHLQQGENSAQIFNNTIANLTTAGLQFDADITGVSAQNNIVATTGGISNASPSPTFAGNVCTAAGTGCAVVGNPQFVNAATGDFHLQSNSPALDIGVTLAAVLLDFEGNTRPQGSGYDAGAFEFVVAAPPPPGALRLVNPWQSAPNLRRR